MKIKNIMATAGFFCGFLSMGAMDEKTLFMLFGLAVALCAPLVFEKEIENGK